MTKYLMDSSGNNDFMGEEEATGYYHFIHHSRLHYTDSYAPHFDAFLGKYKTILGLSIVYCAGHLTLALDETRLGLALGLGLIALGSGGIKPCVSAHVGDQFGKTNAHLLEKVFGWFYFSINLGAFVSTLLTPWLLEHYGPYCIRPNSHGVGHHILWMGRRSSFTFHWRTFSQGFSKEGLVGFRLFIIWCIRRCCRRCLIKPPEVGAAGRKDGPKLLGNGVVVQSDTSHQSHHDYGLIHYWPE